MVDLVEEFLQIQINHPAMTRCDVIARSEHSIVGTAIRPEAGKGSTLPEEKLRTESVQGGAGQVAEWILGSSIASRG